jgi:hypothetical protein
VRAQLVAHRPLNTNGAALPIETGAEVQIGPIMHRNSRQGILEDLGGDLHRADLAAARAALLSKQGKPLTCCVAHWHLGMAHLTGVGGPTWSLPLPRHKPGLYGCDDVAEMCGT